MRHYAFVLLLGCSGGPNEHPELRATVDRAQKSLIESVDVAEAAVQNSAGINARIFITDEYAVGSVATDGRHDLRLDLAGNVLSNSIAGPAGGGCQTQITLEEALAVAEGAAGGDAVAVVPDDDDPCMREIQVLVDVTLWEVKVGPTGSVVETELSDEDLE